MYLLEQNDELNPVDLHSQPERIFTPACSFFQPEQRPSKNICGSLRMNYRKTNRLWNTVVYEVCRGRGGVYISMVISVYASPFHRSRHAIVPSFYSSPRYHRHGRSIGTDEAQTVRLNDGIYQDGIPNRSTMPSQFHYRPSKRKRKLAIHHRSHPSWSDPP
jgi:hypothetical protein